MSKFTILIAFLGFIAGATAFTTGANRFQTSSSALFESSTQTTTTVADPAVDIFQPANDIPGALTRPVDAYGRMAKKKEVSYSPGGMEAAVGSEVAEIITQQKQNGIHCHSSGAEHSRHRKSLQSFF
jgi:hypothetical protein